MKYNTLYICVSIVLLAALVAGCGACGHGGDCRESQGEAADIPVDTVLQRRLGEFAAKPRPAGNFAFHVYDLTADKSVYGYDEDRALPSASCMKLLSGVAGLHLLGCDYEYRPEILSCGRAMPDGCFDGDVAFKAGLDPQFQETDLIPYAEALKAQGISRISGKLMVELVVSEPVRSEEHWFPWDLTLSKYGLFYKGGKKVTAALRYVLRSKGIAVADSQIVLARIPQGFHSVYAGSRPIGDVIGRMWKNSSNTQATSMLYTIGNKYDPQRHPVEAGTDYLRKFMTEELGMTDTTLTVHDGCGLCIYNRLSPRLLTAVLKYGWHDGKIREMLEKHLAVAGVDGTLAREMTGPSTRGKIKAKTGTLSHPYGISSLAGLCETPDGHVIAFAIMDSEMSVLDARVLQRKLCETIMGKNDGRR